jgi:site-specific recombinase XerD
MSDEELLLEIAISQFLDYQRVRKSRTIATINTYRSALHSFSKFVGNIDVSELSVRLVDRYADSLPLTYSEKTLRNKLTPIRSFFSYLYAKDITNIRPEKIDLPTVTEIEANFLDNEEQERLIAACKDVREEALILCFLRSGLRVSELIDAHLDDLHNRSLVVRNGKGRKPRITFIAQDADEAIKAYHATLHPQTYLFPSATGHKISRQYIHRTVRECAQRAGLTKKVSCHTLRHTFATNLLMRGARVEDVQPMMGHTNIRTTMIYMHFTNDYLHSRYDEIMEKTPYKPKIALT